MRVTTWNMQGGTNSMNSKWSEGVAYLLTNGVYKADVVCLQEAGSPPPGANVQARRRVSKEHYFFSKEHYFSGKEHYFPSTIPVAAK